MMSTTCLPSTAVVTALVTAVAFASSTLFAAETTAAARNPSGGLPQAVAAFIESHCMDCHDESTARAGFRIDLLTNDFTADDNAGLWREVMDRINSGEMPPEKKPRPDAKEAFALASWIAQELDKATKAAQGAGGRVPMRRMNRVEYANTVRDLFSLEEGFARRIERELPADGTVGGFDRGAVSLFMDEGQLERYMAVADMVLDEAVFNEQPQVQKLTYDALKAKYIHGIDVCYRDESGRIVDDGPTPEVVASLKEPLSGFSVPEFLDRKTKDKRYVPHGPFDWTMRDGGIEYLAASRFFPEHWPQIGVTKDGWYRFRVNAGAFCGSGEESQKDVKLTVTYCKGSPNEVVKTVAIEAPLDAPKHYDFLMYLQVGPPGMKRGWSVTWDYGERPGNKKDAVVPNPLYHDVQFQPMRDSGWLARGRREKLPAEEIEQRKTKLDESIAAAAENRKTFSGPMWVYNPKLDIAKRPRLWLGTMEWEGPIAEWPPQGRKTLFFEGEGREDDAYLREIVTRFLPMAYRRKVTQEELDCVVDWTLKTKADRGLSFIKAVREGVKNVLCSPTFLYLGSEEMHGEDVREKVAAMASPSPQAVDDWQFASRLSYLLWSSPPDKELYRLAAENRLRDPAILRAQVKRMIADPKSREFVRNFGGQWLSVRNFDNGTPPNPSFYKSYDNALRDSSKREPLEFCNEVLQKDLPITVFLDSDFLVINERLAKHYDIEGVEGDDFRRVPAPADGRRGGVLGMSGILTYLADGTRTLPVRRATWVLDTLWNQPVPPPPPNAGDLPGIKDKKPRSVRERLDEHRTSENCASCHTRVDPFGMALENYDAIGMWRDRQNGEGMKGDDRSPALDVSGRLPSGAAFHTVQDFKAALLAEKETFVKGFTEKLLCYALGRPVGYADHLTVEHIIAEAAKREYRLQEIIQATVASSFFQTK